MSGQGGNLMCTPDSMESVYASPLFDLFGVRMILYLSVVLISYELTQSKSDPNIRLRKLLHLLHDCNMEEELKDVLALMDRLSETCKSPAKLSKALDEVEAQLQNTFPDFLVRLDIVPVVSLPSSKTKKKEEANNSSQSVNAKDGCLESKGSHSNGDDAHQLKEQLKCKHRHDGLCSNNELSSHQNTCDEIPKSFYWSSLYSVLYMIVHQQPCPMLDRFNCPKAFSDPKHLDEFESGSFDHMYFCRCQLSEAASVHESIIISYENTIGSYFFIKKMMTGIFCAFQFEIGKMLKSFYEAWQFQGEMNNFVIPICLLISAFLVDIQLSSYTSVATGEGGPNLFAIEPSFNYEVFPLLVHVVAVFIAIICYAYAFHSLVALTWKESSVALVLARSWPGNIAVDWIIALLVLNILTSSQDDYEHTIPSRVVNWLHSGPLHLENRVLFVAQLGVKVVFMVLQASVTILVLVLFLAPPFEMPYPVQEVGLTIGTVYWLYENTNVYWNDRVTVVERCTGFVVACLAVREWYYHPEALTTGEAFLIYTQLYLVMELWSESWYRVYTVADLKPDLHLMVLLQLPSLAMGGRSSLMGFLANGLQELAKFCFSPDPGAVVGTVDLYLTWLDFVVLKCGGLYAAFHLIFVSYTWLLGDFEPQQLLGPQFALHVPRKHPGAQTSKSRRRKRRQSRHASSEALDTDRPTPLNALLSRWFAAVFPSHTEKDQHASFVADMGYARDLKSKRHVPSPATSATRPVVTLAEKKQMAVRLQKRARARTQSSGRQAEEADDLRRHRSSSSKEGSWTRSDSKVEERSGEKVHGEGEAKQEGWTWVAQNDKARLEEEQRRRMSANENERRKRREKQQRKKERRQERLRKSDDANTTTTSSSVEERNTTKDFIKEEEEDDEEMRKQPSSSSNEVHDSQPKDSRPICVQFLTKNCIYGAQCRKKHPSPEEVTALKQRYARTNCRWGRGCTRKNCLFKHPPKPVQRQSLATIAAKKVGEAWSAAVRSSSSTTSTPGETGDMSGTTSGLRGESTKQANISKSPKNTEENQGQVSTQSNTSNTPLNLGESNPYAAKKFIKGKKPNEFQAKHAVETPTFATSRNNTSAALGFQDSQSIDTSSTRLPLHPRRPPGFEPPLQSLSQEDHTRNSETWHNSTDNRPYPLPLGTSTSFFSFDRTNVNSSSMEYGRRSSNTPSSTYTPMMEMNTMDGRLANHQPTGKSQRLTRKFSLRGNSQPLDPWDDSSLSTPINFDDLLDDPSDVATFTCEACHSATLNALFSPCGHISYCTSCAKKLTSGNLSSFCAVCNTKFSASDFRS